MTRNSEQKLKYLKNEKSFQGELKTFFIILKELSVASNSVRPESVPLIRLLILVSIKYGFDKNFIVSV